MRDIARSFTSATIYAVLLVFSPAGVGAAVSDRHDIVAIWNAAGARADGGAKEEAADAPNLGRFGAVGDGKTDDSEAFARWWTASVVAGQGHMPKGRYVIQSRDIDVGGASETGVMLWGDGAQQSVIVVRNGGLRIDSSVRDAFYSRFVNIGVMADADGPALELGRPDYSDAINSFVFDSVVVNNVRKSPTAIGFQANGVYSSDFRNLVVNDEGEGTAFKLRQVQFSRFQGSAGNADVAMRLTDGYNIGNTFSGFDFEEVGTDVVIDSPKAVNNVFLGNQYVWRKTAIDATAGRNNVFVAPNFASAAMANAISRNVGIVVLGDYGGPDDVVR